MGDEMYLRVLGAAGFVTAVAAAAPASAGRTVIDAGMQTYVSGYCSPIAAGTADCQAKPLGFTITLGSQSYDSFVVHSNGVFSLGGPIDDLDRSSTLSTYKPPVFSPLLSNAETIEPNPNIPGQTGNDGAFVADYTAIAGKLTLRWYPCSTKLFCGPQSVDSSFYSGGQLTQDYIKAAQGANWSIMTLAKLDDGFSVEFSYSPRLEYKDGVATPSTAPIHYGFDLPTASFEADGAAVSRTYRFDSSGALVTSAVPEPTTWISMIVGFSLLGTQLRRGRAMSQTPTSRIKGKRPVKVSRQAVR